jgi:hypothetical protein
MPNATTTELLEYLAGEKLEKLENNKCGKVSQPVREQKESQIIAFCAGTIILTMQKRIWGSA